MKGSELSVCRAAVSFVPASPSPFFGLICAEEPLGASGRLLGSKGVLRRASGGADGSSSRSSSSSWGLAERDCIMSHRWVGHDTITIWLAAQQQAVSSRLIKCDKVIIILRG